MKSNYEVPQMRLVKLNIYSVFMGSVYDQNGDGITEGSGDYTGW